MKNYQINALIGEPARGPVANADRFLLVISIEVAAGKVVRPEHAVRAEEALETLKKRDPKIVEEQLKYLIRNPAQRPPQ